MKELLIIFVRNPVLGKVKTRLAVDVGDDAALRIYQKLLVKTFEVTRELPLTKWVYYSDSIDTDDNWGSGYSRKLQKGSDLDERLLNAFREAFGGGFERVCIIGSDCYELTSEIIIDAFLSLKENSFVIGPARDGGYFLLGMTELEERVFLNKTWSTNLVAGETIKDFERLGKSYHVLPELSDIDTLVDLQSFPELKALAGSTGSHID